ncbi:hypothetical protein Tco_0984681 [Tanacetum coccineum]
MDIQEEIRLSKEDKLPESSGLPYSGQQSVKGRRGLVSPKKGKSDSPKKRQSAHEGIVSGRGSTVASRASKVTGRGSSRKWITSDMAIAAKASRQVLNPKPVSEFNPTVGHVVPIKDKESDVVKDKDSVVVNYPAELDQEKDKEKHKASAKEPVSIVDRVMPLKESAADVKEKSDGKDKKSTVDKDNDKTKLMFDGTLATDEAKWDSFSNQVKSQFGGNVDGLALQALEVHLRLEYSHEDYKELGLSFNMNILRFHLNHLKDSIEISWISYESLEISMYKSQRCKLGLPGLVAESGLQLDMLRRLRFKFATKILLHEINVHAQKMLDLAKEFDKLESDEKVSIIVNALKNRKERDRI